MKIKFLVLGKTNFAYLKEGETIYENRIIHYCNFLRVAVSHEKNQKNIPLINLPHG